MTLIELNPVAKAALPVQAFKDHLRLGTGFADDGAEDALAESYLRAALAAIEMRTGKAILARDFRLEIVDWRDDWVHALPIAPVLAIGSVTLRDAAGAAETVDPARYALERDPHRPKLKGAGGYLPAIPAGGTVEVAFTAGFGAAWADVPPDLAQAVFLLAAEYHEHRHEAGKAASMSFGIAALIERWRNVRVLGGGAA
ncbi:hypothetical protein OEW28_07810 [Defluviimonas sp. WL0002]|uniref:Phage gp6-like head-tail connector protein n=1 Tax=Albidovulum marisflavi TaxID=2984159 RepID=A0ABT2ZCQ5_9RHOB|nr:hypothetical protein [Defluviimonas sp. WL0002]MCV2868531.1 hypothetical protein [Defluviimonas sp. WL0002]